MTTTAPPTVLGLAHKWRAITDLTGGLRHVREVHGMGRLAQLREYTRFRRAIGVSPAEFYRHELWDQTRSDADRMSFMGWADRRILERYLNPRSSRRLGASKLEGDAWLHERGLPTPTRLAVWDPCDAAPDATDAVRSPEELTALLLAHPDGLVLKRDTGSSGEQVIILNAIMPTRVVTSRGEEWTMAQLLGRLGTAEGWLVQERVVSHPDLVHLTGTSYPSSLRLVTCRRADGRVFTLPGTLKLASATNGMDNFGLTGTAVAVERDGWLGRGALGWNGPVIDRYADTGVAFAGIQVPYWREAVAAVTRGQAELPTLWSTGWDVAITPAGPRILEANAWWGADLIQKPGQRGLVQGEFVEFVRERGGEHVLRLPARRAAGVPC